MSTEFSGETTTAIVRKCAAGDRIALEELVLRYNWKMVQLANRYMRRLRVYNATSDAEDAVNDTLTKLCQRAIDGELRCIQSSNEFWRMFFSMLKVEIRDARDRDDALKRGGPGRARFARAGVRRGHGRWQRSVAATNTSLERPVRRLGLLAPAAARGSGPH